MNIQALRAYCAVVELRSFAKASRRLDCSTPTMTRLIQSVESELDLVLLHRSTRLVVPTEAGELFYQQALDLVRQYDSGVSALQQLTTRVSGRLKIGVPASINRLWLMPSLHRFYQQYPDVDIQVVIGNHLLDLLSERFDLVVHCSDLKDSNLYAQPIRQWHKVTCASPDYLASAPALTAPSDLSEHNCLDHYDNVSQTWRYKVNNKHVDAFVAGNTRVNNSLDLKQLAIANLGVVYLPSFTVQDALDRGELVAVLEDCVATTYPMTVVYSERQRQNKKITAFIKFLDDILPG